MSKAAAEVRGSRKYELDGKDQSYTDLHMVFSTFMYQGWYQPKPAAAARKEH